MPLMDDADKMPSPAKRPRGKDSPLTTISAKTNKHDPVIHDHYDVSGPKETPKAYHAGGFGWGGENTNLPGEGPRPHKQRGGLAQDDREPKPKPSVTERAHRVDSKMTVPSKIMDMGASKKVTPDSTYPYDTGEFPADPLHEDPSQEAPAQSNPREMVIVLWHFGYNDQTDATQGEGMPTQTTTLGEFFDSNPDIAEDPAQVKAIIDTLMAGKTYQEDLGAGGLYGMKRVDKTNENAMGAAVSAGNIGTAPARSLFTTKRTTEDEGDAEEQDDDLVEGQIVEFVRNGVPYRGRVMGIHGNNVLVSTAGRKMSVERSVFEATFRRNMLPDNWKPHDETNESALSGLNGAAEPTSRGTTKYGVKTAKQNHAQSSPTTPNKTMQKFVGASEAIGDDQSDEQVSAHVDPNQMSLPGMQVPNSDIGVDEITAPAYWASALINGDHSGLDDTESKQVKQFEQDLASRGMSVVSDVEGSERFTNSFHLYNYGGDPKIRGGGVLDYVVHVRPEKPTQSVSENVWGAGPHPTLKAQVRNLASYLRQVKGYLVKPQEDGAGYLFPIGSVCNQDPSLDWNDITAHIRDYAMSHNWRLDKTDEGDLIVRTSLPVGLD